MSTFLVRMPMGLSKLASEIVVNKTDNSAVIELIDLSHLAYNKKKKKANSWRGGEK